MKSKQLILTLIFCSLETISSVALSAMALSNARVAQGPDIDTLRSRFVNPPKGSGTTTLWWLNGTLSKAEIREQMLNLRDKDGFGGIAPLPLYSRKPATEPAYLTDEYFEMYGCILDTAKELGMTVGFYDDNDFPSGRAGTLMAERYPEGLLKYLARETTTVQGPGEAVLRVKPGKLLSVVAKNLDSGERRVVTAEATLSRATRMGGSVGFRQPPEEAARYETFRVLDKEGRLLFEDRFENTLSNAWEHQGASRIEKGGLYATDCQPMSLKGLQLPEAFTIESRLTILRGAAAIAFGVKGEDDFWFWQFNANMKAIRPHLRHGGYRPLEKAPFPFETNRAYDVRLVGDGETVTTWIDNKRIATHFGTTIRMSFYDDLSVYQAPDDLIWTPSFNEKFQKRFGRSPEALYPALWEDIGPETGAARASLYGMRNELFAAGYPRVVEEWGAKRGMKCAGHPAGAYDPNPLQLSGDGILFYKYQQAPLTDYIHYHGHGLDGFKVPTSAAYNFDRDTMVCEIYGNFHQKLPNDSNMLYRAAMEVYARGVNYLLPHGTWWDADKMGIVPEISWRNPVIGPELPNYNRWAARCESLLRVGRHVADIAVLYPIDDLEARTAVGPQSGKHGKTSIPGTDYYSNSSDREVMADVTLREKMTLALWDPHTGAIKYTGRNSRQ